ncbi:DUF2157 domain-containing protein [Hoeflea sp. YIM 152468]|uniref:DUF2157 domain-containing protein n=1 Tax=Hoeflea sp. YIM 152468 TaxID=3031759 RepID=UPI0023DB262E|nr:DUF2157 domain-containing protein [Hoeflea sp. YIM 152468]MDF1609908.1 DUF2157 domain-containing protein [Hoeflea sp. YIM 152468]
MFRRYLCREIDQWTQAGLLQPGQGAELLADHDRRHTGFKLSSVLAILAAVLFGAAVIALVAANWDAIARPLRVGMIFLFILSGLFTAAVALRRGAGWLSEAALVFALLCHGAGIALTGQMYHLSGDEAAFMLVWTSAALVVSFCFRSPMAAVGAGLLAFGYLLAQSAAFGSRAADVSDVAGYLTVVVLALVVGLASWRSRSTVAAHLCALILIGWVVWVVDDTTDLDLGYVLAAIGAVAFGIGSLGASRLGGGVVRHGTVSAYGAVLFLSGLIAIQVELADPGLVSEIVLAALVMLASVAIVAVAGGDNRFIRRFAYFTFAGETIYVVGETLGSLLGSAGFLFLGGLVLAVIAFAVMKIEKRFKAGEGRS